MEKPWKNGGMEGKKRAKKRTAKVRKIEVGVERQGKIGTSGTVNGHRQRVENNITYVQVIKRFNRTFKH